MPRFPGGLLKNAFAILVTLIATCGWGYVMFNVHRAHGPVEIVKKHFVFYPGYAHGVWRESACAGGIQEKCVEVKYTIPVQGCGAVTFDWRVLPGDDGDESWSYNGARADEKGPDFDEAQYPPYAILNPDSQLIDSPALGKPLPQTCRLK